MNTQNKFVTKLWKKIFYDGLVHIVITKIKWSGEIIPDFLQGEGKVHFVAKNRVIMLQSGYLCLFYFENKKLCGQVLEKI